MRTPNGARAITPVVLLLVLALAGCADKEPTPVSTTPAAPTKAIIPVPSPSTSAVTTTALPGMPVPISIGDSPVDPASIRSTRDLPTAFGCPAGVTPITIPATPTAAPPATATSGISTVTATPADPVTVTPAPPTSPAGPTVPGVPDAIVCTSGLAKEALYLWYTPTQEEKLGALTVALKRAKYVHGGPNWVAAGTVNPTMGTVGGEVYR